ncbi:hypothetical protein WJX81_003043 [Elliptochloris bilobata]|uniref:Uncharacterized protein n=1 Tax=Elliptochloris bilobata TaxID=381761 RepID=A0AAW1S0C5_9CHLO
MYCLSRKLSHALAYTSGHCKQLGPPLQRGRSQRSTSATQPPSHLRPVLAESTGLGHGWSAAGNGTMPLLSPSGLAGSCVTEIRLMGEMPDQDPTLNKELASSRRSITTLFTHDDWEYHQTTSRYFRNLFNIGGSAVFRRCLAPCLLTTLFAALIVGYNLLALRCGWPLAAMALTPHTLLGSALSLLLVFRTNASFARMVEARQMWGTVVRNCREWIRLVSVYFPRELLPPAMAYVQAFAIVLKGQLRCGRTRVDPHDPTRYRYDAASALLHVVDEAEAERLLSVHNPPGAVARRLTRLVATADQGGLPAHVPLRLDDCIAGLTAAASGCDRLFKTPIPLSYTRHTARSLMMWLLTLPAALWPKMGPSLIFAVFFISYVLIGIDELGVQIEEPFAILPLAPLMMKVRNEQTCTLSCPIIYFRVALRQDGTARKASPALMRRVLQAGLQQLFGTIGGALPFEVVGMLPGAGRAVVRADRGDCQKLWAAASLLTQYDGRPCTLTVEAASPFLASLAVDSRAFTAALPFPL